MSEIREALESNMTAEAMLTAAQNENFKLKGALERLTVEKARLEGKLDLALELLEKAQGRLDE